MHVLRIEHPVADFEAWKRAFDSDPVGRKDSGVSRYRVLRPADDPKFVTIDLEFESFPEAEAMLVRLRSLWKAVEGRVVESPKARILEAVETRDL